MCRKSHTFTENLFMFVEPIPIPIIGIGYTDLADYRLSPNQNIISEYVFLFLVNKKIAGKYGEEIYNYIRIKQIVFQWKTDYF